MDTEQKREEDVKMAEHAVGKGSDVLASLGLGSCVAVALYDNENSIGGLAHVMLPTEEGETSPKHADVLIERLVNSMERKGADMENVKAKIFGGASMFGHENLNIGEKNVETVKQELKQLDIPLIAEDTGGGKGRAVWLNCRSGDVVVRKKGEQTKRY